MLAQKTNTPTVAACCICFDESMTTFQVAECLGISRTTAWRMVRDGTFKTARRIGSGRGHFSIDALEVAMLLRGEKVRAS